jgi:hypothetical protein
MPQARRQAGKAINGGLLCAKRGKGCAPSAGGRGQARTQSLPNAGRPRCNKHLPCLGGAVTPWRPGPRAAPRAFPAVLFSLRRARASQLPHPAAQAGAAQPRASLSDNICAQKGGLGATQRPSKQPQGETPPKAAKRPQRPPRARTWSAAKPSMPCPSLSTAMASPPCSAPNRAPSKAGSLASRQPAAAASGDSARGRGSLEASSSASSAGAMVILSHLSFGGVGCSTGWAGRGAGCVLCPCRRVGGHRGASARPGSAAERQAGPNEHTGARAARALGGAAQGGGRGGQLRRQRGQRRGGKARRQKAGRVAGGPPTPRAR